MPLLLLFTACQDDPKAPINIPPGIEILSHQEGDRVVLGATEIFIAEVSDSDDIIEEVYVQWMSGETVLCPFELVDSQGGVSCELQLPIGSTGITALAQDPDGGQGMVTLDLDVVNPQDPIVEITAPLSNTKLYSDVAIAFEGVLSDSVVTPQELSVNWNSSLDGDFTGESTPATDGTSIAEAVLSEGDHTITLEGENPFGMSGFDELAITVGGPNQLPICSIISPLDLEVIPAGAAYTFWGLGTDADIAEPLLLSTWSSSLDGELSSQSPDINGNSSFDGILSPGAHVLQMQVEDEVGGLCTAEVTVVANEVPSVVINMPLEGTLFSELESIGLNITASDLEDLSETLVVDVSSSLDGDLGLFVVDPTGEGLLDVILSPGTHNLVVTVTDSVGFTGQANLSILVNALPTMPIVLVSPNPAESTDDVQVSAYGSSDPDGGVVSYSYEWTKDGQVQSNTSTLVPSSETLKNEEWHVSVLPFDGTAYGPAGEASIVIRNAPPTVTAVTISPSNNVMSDDVLNCSASVYDPDESPSVVYEWTNDGNFLASGDVVDLSLHSILPTSEIRCEVTATDGEGAIGVDSSAINILNTNPVVDSIVITPDPIYADTFVTCVATASDLDGDSPFLTYSWYKNGVGAGVGDTLQLSPNQYVPGDTLSCSVTAIDSFGGLVIETLDVIVENTDPEITQVVIAPDPAYADSILTCSVQASDLNELQLSESYDWINDTTGASLGTQTSLLLTAQTVSPSDTVRCSVTVTDSQGASVVEEIEVLISNTLPYFTGLPSISPTTGVVIGQELSCSANAIDLNDGVVSIDYRWEVDGIAVQVGDLFIPDESISDVSSVITCFADAIDQDGGIFSEFVSVSLENTAPVILDVSISPDVDVTSSTTLNCVVDVVDADNGPLLTSYIWRNISNSSTMGTGSAYTLRPQDASPGDSVECEVTVADLDGGADTLASSVLVTNTLPVVDTVTISPDTNVVNLTTLTCVAVGSDEDDESMTYDYSWTNVSTNTPLGLGGSLTLDPLSSTPGDEIECLATATDESGGSAENTAMVLVENTAPVIDSLEIVPNTGVTTQSELTCDISASDVDGGVPSLEFEWENITTGQILGTSQTLTLNPQISAPNQSIQCSATASDTDSGSVNDVAVIIVVNSDPVISSVTISPNIDILTSSSLTCSAIVDDPDDSSFSLQFEWSNTSSGDVIGLGSSINLNSGIVAPGESIQCEVSATDLDGGVGTNAAVVTLENTLPVVDTVVVTPPSGVSTQSTLSCTATASDADGDIPSIDYSWINDSTGVSLGVGDSIELTPSTCSPNDLIFCIATATDQDGGSSSATGAVTVENSDPSVDMVSITPDTAVTTSSVLNCSALSSDSDGGTPVVSFEWMNEQSGQTLGTGPSLTLNPVDSTPTNTILCVATATDLDGGSGSSTTGVLVDNSEPQVENVEISPDTLITTGTTLSCSADGVDVDGGSPSLFFTWTNETSGTGLGSTDTVTLSSTSASPDDIIRCEVTAVDIHSGTGSSIAEVQVENSAPSVSDVIITPDFDVSTITTVGCSGTIVDSDGGSPILSYVWSNLTTGAEIGTAEEQSLSPSISSPGDTIQCILTATDENGGSTSGSAEVEVVNLDPVISAVSITPDPFYNNSTLSCEISVTDPDAQSMVETFSWTNNSSGLNLGTGPVVSLTNTNSSPNDEISCAVLVEDISGGSSTSEVITLVTSRPPVIDSVSVSPNSSITTSTVLTCSASASDVDVESTTISYAWTNGNATLGTDAELVLTSSNSAPGDVIICEALASDAGGLTASDTASVTVDNSAPVFSNVTILPGTAYNNSTLICSVGVSEPDGQPISTTYQWVNVTEGTTLGTSPLQGLSSSIASPSDELSCLVTATDSGGLSSNSSGTVFLTNRAPNLGTVYIDPSSGVTTTSTLSCSTTATDDDGEIPVISYVWTNGGSVIGTASEITLDWNIVAPGDNLYCTATATDSVGEIDSDSTLVSIDNTAPVITDLTISPSPGYNDSILTCIVTATDVDGQNLSSNFTWLNIDTGVALGIGATLNLNSTSASTTDVIRCTAQVTDSSGDSDTATGDLTISNRAPTVSSVTVTPSSGVLTSTVLTCSATSIDLDDDVTSFGYVWTNNGNTIGSDSRLSLTPSNSQPSDIIMCTATVTDSNSATGSDTATIQVENTDPVVSTVTIGPSTGYNDSTLTCTVVASDDDNQSLTTSYVWSNETQGTTLGTASSLALSSSSASVGDIIRCLGTVEDPSGGTHSGYDDRVMTNRNPSISSLSIAPSTAYNDSTLACSVIATDIDGQSLSTAYLWMNETQGTVLGSSGSLTLSSSGASSGDVIVCETTVTDPTGGSATSSTDVELTNRAPTVDSVSISPPSGVTTSSSLVCVAAASDVDGSAPSISYVWTNSTQNTTLSVGASLTLTPSIAQPFDSIVCTATAVDEGGADDVLSAAVEVENTLPTITNVGVTPAVAYNNSTLTCSSSSSDSDNQSLTESYSWTNISRNILLGTGASISLSSSTASVGDSIRCVATVSDPNGGSDTEFSDIEMTNRDPVVNSVTIGPLTAYTSTTLSCGASVSDIDDDSTSVGYVWRNGNVILGSGASITLSASVVSPGDTVTCSATVSDPHGGSGTGSSSIEISNTDPVISSVTVGPSTAYNNTTMNCSYAASDADSQSLSGAYVWINDSTSTTLGTGASLELSSLSSSPTDVIRCLVTVTDSSNGTDSASSSKTLTNRSPSISSTSISPTSPTTSTSLTCLAAGTDPDNDALTISMVWTNSTQSTSLGSRSSMSLTPSNSQPGDVIVCTSTVMDSYGATGSSTASVQVGNTDPVVSSVAISPSTAYNNSTLSCGVVSSDADGQSLSTSYTWTNESTGSILGSGSSLSLSSNTASPNDDIRCNVTVTDPSSGSDSSSASKIITNRSPSISSVSVSPSSVEVGETLSCNVSASDADNQSLSTTYMWFISSNVSSSIGTGSTYVTQDSDAGYQLGCTATVSDGITSSTSSTGNYAEVLDSSLTINGTTQTLTTGTYTYSSVSITNGGILYIVGDVEINTTDMYLDSSSTIDGSGSGGNGGAINSSGIGSGAGGGSSNSGTGGGAYGGSGGNGGYDSSDSIGSGGSAFGTSSGTDISVGGGSGGNACSTGANGGAGLSVYASGAVNIVGTINVDGASGGVCDSGGSSGGDGTVRHTDGTWYPVDYEYCGASCNATQAKAVCTSAGKKVVSHASDGTSEVFSLGATNSCQWSVSYYTVQSSMSSNACLVGISNLEWSGCCGTTSWHGNTISFGSPGSVFGYVNSSNSGFNSSYSNSSGSTWGCNSEGTSASQACSEMYVACLGDSEYLGTGGGAGGGVLFYADSTSASIILNGNITARGGDGGSGQYTSDDGGGGGGGGRIKVLNFTTITNSGSTDVSGGLGGDYGNSSTGIDGSDGAVYIESSDGSVMKIDGSWIDVTYEACGSPCNAANAKAACTAVNKKVVSHASNGTSEVYSLGASNSCNWSVSYFTVNTSMSSDSCLVGVSNLEWSGCCGPSDWHGNTLSFGSPGAVFGFVNSSNSGYNGSYSNSSGSTWGCMGEGSSGSSCTNPYVACAN